MQGRKLKRKDRVCINHRAKRKNKHIRQMKIGEIINSKNQKIRGIKNLKKSKIEQFQVKDKKN